jgi:hypothetical protein
MDNRRDIRALGVPLSHVRSEVEETPPSDRIRDLVRNEQQKRVECRVECRSQIEDLGRRTVEAERKASSATRLASEADARAATIDTKFRIIIGMLSGLSAIVLAVVGWLVVQLQSAHNRAREVAEVVSEKTILAADRRLDERLKAERSETIRALLDEQARRGKDPDLVTVARTK